MNPNNRKVYVAIGIALLLFSILGGIFGPAFIQRTKERDEARTETKTYKSENETLKAELSESREAIQKSYVKFSSKIPIFGPNGQTAYAETSGTSYNMSQAKESIERSIQDAAAKVSTASTVAVTIHEKDTETVKRQTVAAGGGWTTNGLPCVTLDGKIIGSVILWGAAEVDPKRIDGKFIRTGMAGAKLTFF